ncbi:SPNS2 protein, partial [Polyodon spathula]|nr:SPNS2 protein [Polyodon spathula]
MMLSVFYFAIPLGSAKHAAGDWHWALRVSPVLGMTAGTLIFLFVPEPKRGSADQLGGRLKARTPWICDMRALAKNRSYVFSSLASAAVSFATGAFGMWIPLYLFRAQVVQKSVVPCDQEPCSIKDSLIFGVITCVTGFLGVIIGAAATRLCRLKTERADPLVCAVSMLGSAIFICLIFVAAKKSIVGAYICIFIGETLLFLNWAITADILMYVVIPTRRATAVALQSFTSHALGDAGSPYLIGLISDAIQQSYTESILWQFLSLGYALMLCPFVIVLGGMFFLATALFFLDDRDKAEKQLGRGEDENTLSSDACAVSQPLLFTLQTRCAATSELQRRRTTQLWAAYRQARRGPVEPADIVTVFCEGLKRAIAVGRSVQTKPTARVPDYTAEVEDSELWGLSGSCDRRVSKEPRKVSLLCTAVVDYHTVIGYDKQQ